MNIQVLSCAVPSAWAQTAVLGPEPGATPAVEAEQGGLEERAAIPEQAWLAVRAEAREPVEIPVVVATPAEEAELAEIPERDEIAVVAVTPAAGSNEVAAEPREWGEAAALHHCSAWPGRGDFAEGLKVRGAAANSKAGPGAIQGAHQAAQQQAAAASRAVHWGLPPRARMGASRWVQGASRRPAALLQPAFAGAPRLPLHTGCGQFAQSAHAAADMWWEAHASHALPAAPGQWAGAGCLPCHR